MLSNAATKEVIEKFQRFPGDMGSSEVQIALLSSKIELLTGHLKIHKKDFHSRRGLLRMVSQRRKLLDYLKRVNVTLYQDLIGKLGLRK